jgi:hypothetical protein
MKSGKSSAPSKIQLSCLLISGSLAPLHDLSGPLSSPVCTVDNEAGPSEA